MGAHIREDIEMIERTKIRLENLVRLQAAASILRDVLPDEEYDISLTQLHAVTTPLALIISRILEQRSDREDRRQRQPNFKLSRIQGVLK